MKTRTTLWPIAAALTAMAGSVSSARAEDAGKVPYWASIRAGEVNMRVGPGEDYRISWVYHRPQLPIKVLRIREGWRLVADPAGTKGWMLARFLTRQRNAVVAGHVPAPMLERPDPASRLLWRAAPGLLGRLGKCDGGWCSFNVGGREGFVAQTDLFGAGEP